MSIGWCELTGEPSSWTELAVRAAGELERAGVASPRADAELLAANAAGVTRPGLFAAPAPSQPARRRFELTVARRVGREPLQHIVGVAPFWRSELEVGPGVFVPRPETELLVEWTLKQLVGQESPTVVDLCAGSGALALALAGELPDAQVYAVERDERAARWLRRNLAGSAVRAVEADALDPATLAELDGACDAVVSNPPYVPSGAELEAEVRSDPPQALYGGRDGLAVLRPLIDRTARLLRPGGVAAIEHDDSHAEAAPELLRVAGLEEATAHRDLAGRPRFATARRVG